MNGKREDEYLSQNTIDENVTNNCSFLKVNHSAILCSVSSAIPASSQIGDFKKKFTWEKNIKKKKFSQC